jgi:hypothetical protein
MQSTSFELQYSKQFFLLNVILTIATLFIILFLPCLFWIKFLLLVFMIVYPSQLFNQPAIILTRDNEGWLLSNKNQSFRVNLCGSSIVTHYICILRFKIPGKYFKRSYMIFRDSIKPPMNYRRFVLTIL